jgi:hypothetical protein
MKCIKLPYRAKAIDLNYDDDDDDKYNVKLFHF